MAVPHYRGGPQILPVDRRGRMSLGPDYGGKSFTVQTHEDGTITLTPVVDTPDDCSHESIEGRALPNGALRQTCLDCGAVTDTERVD